MPLPDASFDLAISEYGAAIWCDPYRWIPEAARLLRPGGRLVFLGNATLLDAVLARRGGAGRGPPGRATTSAMHRFAWPGEASAVEFHLGYGDMIRLLRASGFEVENLVELRAPEGATTRYPYVTPEWARRWPSEEVWIARKRA